MVEIEISAVHAQMLAIRAGWEVDKLKGEAARARGTARAGEIREEIRRWREIRDACRAALAALGQAVPA